MNREGLCVKSMEIFWLWSQNNLLFPHNKNKKRNEVGGGGIGEIPPCARGRIALLRPGSRWKELEHKSSRRRKKGSSRGPSASQPGGKPLVSCRTWLCSHGARGGEAVVLLNKSGERAARGRGVRGVNFNRCFWLVTLFTRAPVVSPVCVCMCVFSVSKQQLQQHEPTFIFQELKCERVKKISSV